MKNNKAILALLGIGAIVMIVYLMRRSASATTATPATPAGGAGQQSYPNGEPIKLGDISIGGSPVNLTYNVGPLPSNLGVTSDAEKKGCCGNDCPDAGVIVARNLIPEKVLAGAAQNFAGYTLKLAGNPPSPAPISPTTSFVNYYDFAAVNY